MKSKQPKHQMRLCVVGSGNMKYLTTRLSSFVKPAFAKSRYYSEIRHVMQSEQNYFTLPEMVRALEEFAPLSLAEKWDNVGLLIEPSKPRFEQHGTILCMFSILSDFLISELSSRHSLLTT